MDLKLWVLAVGLLNQNSAIADYWWSEEKAETPPKFQPYELPTLAGDNLDYHDKPEALIKAPVIDAERLFLTVMACYPADSNWNIDIKLQAKIKTNSDDLFYNEEDSTISSNYIGIVASMPLYSSKEVSRDKEREYRRRTDIASIIAKFVGAIASRNRALRELSLYRSLEARSSVRVKNGIASATEQIGFLEKVSARNELLIKTEMDILQNRLQLASTCELSKYDQINNYLKKVAMVRRIKRTE
ncbi:MAG: hypothetical protein GY787_03855 [Alteromonadales bacterium]|nr:hypothetical protein [Alteromonadales bacterium]